MWVSAGFVCTFGFPRVLTFVYSPWCCLLCARLGVSAVMLPLWICGLSVRATGSVRCHLRSFPGAARIRLCGRLRSLPVVARARLCGRPSVLFPAHLLICFGAACPGAAVAFVRWVLVEDHIFELGLGLRLRSAALGVNFGADFGSVDCYVGFGVSFGFVVC